jgi:hypothetical protein
VQPGTLKPMTEQRGGGRAWLDVPYAEKDQAKALGARWDPTARRWYAPPSAAPGLEGLHRPGLHRKDVPDPRPLRPPTHPPTHPPADGRVVCVDEFGPLNLLPRKGQTGRPRGRPRRLRATYHRHHGVMHLLAALDLATGRLFYRIRSRTRWIEFLACLETLRARWPGEKLYVVCDNFSPHRHAQVRTWCADHEVELVFLPTYGSWLNWIEAEFAGLRYFALNGTDHRSHTEQNTAIAGYVRWRNTQARPKVNFATDSPIRTWTDYPAKAA